MFSAVASSTLPPRSQPSSTSKPYGLHIPRTFSVNVFKGSPPSSYSYATPSKHSSNTRSSPPQPVAREGAMWYPPRSESNGKNPTAVSSEPHRPHYASNPPPTTRAYESNQPRTSPNYSIHPSTSVKGIYVYEPSIKSDIYSDSEADTSLPPSPTDTEDSTETIKSPLLSELALDDDKPQDANSTPSTTSRNPFPLHIPALSQATSVLKGVFQSAPPDASKTLPSTSLPPHGSSSRSTRPEDRASPPNQGRSAPAPRHLVNGGIYGDVNASTSMVGPPPVPPYAVPIYADSLTSDCEANDIDPLARHNTALNSLPSGHLFMANSAPSSSTIPIPTSDMKQDRRVSPDTNTADAGSRRGYGDLPMRSSPEQDSVLAQVPRDPVAHSSDASGYIDQEPSSDAFPRSSSSTNSNRFGRNDASPTSSSSAASQSSNTPTSSAPPPPSGLSRQPSSSAVAADYSPPGSNRSGDRRSERPLPTPSSISPQRSTRGNSSPQRATYSPPGGLSEYFHGQGAASRSSPPRRRTSVDPSPHPPPPHGATRYQELPPTDSPPLLSRPYEPHVQTSSVEGYSRSRKDSLSRSRPTYAPEMRDRDYERGPAGGSKPVANWDPYNYAIDRDRERDRERERSGGRPRTMSQIGRSSSRTSPPKNTAGPSLPTYDYAPASSSAEPTRREVNSTTTQATHNEQKYDQWNIPFDPPASSYPQAPQQHSSAVNGSTPTHAMNYPTDKSYRPAPSSSKVSGAGNTTTAEYSHRSPQTSGSPPRSSTRNSPEYTHQQPPQRRYSDPGRPPSSSSSSSSSSSTTTSSSTSTSPSSHGTEPQRRYSDGDQTIPPGSAKSIAQRSVRWNQNLICPSPVFSNQRRQGWWNRRGDQLWTNDGAYRPAPPGEEYPPDLDGYPEYGQGWQNEEGIRIDMGHRLVPKIPLRSALKCRPGFEDVGKRINIVGMV